MIKAVIDTSIWVSAFITKTQSASVLIYQAFTKQQFVSVTSPQIMAEVEEVLNRDHIIARHQLPLESRQKVVQKLATLSYMTTGNLKLEASPDPKDDMFIAAAVEAQADYVVSLDKCHLIKLKQYQGIRILNAGEFLEILRIRGK